MTRGSTLLRVATALYALFLLAALVLLYPLGDRYWLSTLLLVGPRFVLGLPLPLLALLALALDRRLLWGARLARDWVDASPGPSRLVAGDFNMTVESAVFREHWAGYEDAFSAAGFGFGFTKRTRRFGTRIDHILMGPGWVCLRVWVGAHGHDHFPVLADLRFVG